MPGMQAKVVAAAGVLAGVGHSGGNIAVAVAAAAANGTPRLGTTVVAEVVEVLEDLSGANHKEAAARAVVVVVEHCSATASLLAIIPLTAGEVVAVAAPVVVVVATMLLVRPLRAYVYITAALSCS